MKVAVSNPSAGMRFWTSRRVLSGWCLAVIGVIATLNSADAAPISFSFTGTVDSANSDNEFGLQLGDTIVLSGVYDSSYYNGVGKKTVPFDFSTGNTLTLKVGAFVVDQTNDSLYYQRGYPSVTFYNGQFSAVDLYLEKGVNNAPVNLILNVPSFIGMDEFGNQTVTALFQFTTGHSPEPSSMLLAGTAAIGLGLLVRRRK